MGSAIARLRSTTLVNRQSEIVNEIDLEFRRVAPVRGGWGMTRRWFVITLAASTLWLTPAAHAQNRAGDIGAGPIEGTWAVTGSERDGVPWREIAGATMTIGGGQ